MARGVNKVILIGNLGADPEVRYTAGGQALATVKLATSESWTDKEGNKQERTEWHRVKFFGRLAEVVGEYLKKGRQVYVEGSIRTDKYTGQDGIERYATDIIANEMQMLGGPPGSQSGGAGGGYDDGNGRPMARGAGGGQQRPQQQGNRPAPPPAEDFEDDIPF